MAVDALDVWGRICKDACENAVRFYTSSQKCSWEKLEDRKRKNEFSNLAKDILVGGSTNFDKKYFRDNPDEQPGYRADFYIWCSMDMHLKQDLKVLRTYLQDTLSNDRHIVFVDFGCGPMTSGLALAEILSKDDEDYKERVTYLGIDASQNMVKRAKWINEQYEIFAPDRSMIVKDTIFNSARMAELPSAKNAELVILCLSFVLASGTNKVAHCEQEAWLQNLAETWHRYVSGLSNLNETRIVYLNPGRGFSHENWKKFEKELRDVRTDGSFFYSDMNIEYIDVPNLPGRPAVAAAQVIGKKKTNSSQ